ncbi:MAG: class I SAM-dependent methyltransferase [bacterium]|nr:class I SAM-dependent methyltransferase [bacterium]
MSATKHTNCLICYSTDLKLLEAYSNVGLVKCQSCNFVFSERIPSMQELLDYYSNNYERTSYLSPITVKRFNEILDRFEPYRKTGKLLDVGAGYGFFMEVAKERGWDVYGTELTDEAVDHCKSKGLKMYKGEFHELDLESESFDVIVSIEVLEHLNTPNHFASKANEILRKGGVLYLTTPNFNSFLRYRLKEQYKVIEYPNHLCYYTPKTLKNLFTSKGFDPLAIKTTGISLTRLRTSKGKSDQEYVCETSDDEMLRYRIEKNPALKVMKSSTNGVLNLLKMGDSLKGYFQKK